MCCLHPKVAKNVSWRPPGHHSTAKKSNVLLNPEADILTVIYIQLSDFTFYLKISSCTSVIPDTIETIRSSASRPYISDDCTPITCVEHSTQAKPTRHS